MAEALWRWSASELAVAIRNRDCSSEEVVRAHLERIDAVNPRVNAVTMILAEEALNAARRADEQVASGAEPGPLHGVPFTVKENVDVVGTPTTSGVVMLGASMPQRDAPVVAHLRAAGAIPIGRTNLPEFGLRYHTDNDLHGATRNPWDESRTPGGSSGGEAAAIATGMSPFGVGNDMAGSLRYPAQCCGIASFRPGFGRVSRVRSRNLHGASDVLRAGGGGERPHGAMRVEGSCVSRSRSWLAAIRAIPAGCPSLEMARVRRGRCGSR